MSRPSNPPPIRVCVIGGGITGLGAAWLLAACANPPGRYEVTLYEAAAHFGGHAEAVTVYPRAAGGGDVARGGPAPAAAATDTPPTDGAGGGSGGDSAGPTAAAATSGTNGIKSLPQSPPNGTVPILLDAGFIVFNRRTYPQLTALFEYLHVPVGPSDMSFALSTPAGEWGSDGPSTLFPSFRALASLRRWRMLADVVRFNAAVAAATANPNGGGLPPPTTTLGEWLTEQGLGEAFTTDYLLPMVAAVWSSSPAAALAFPAASLLTFFGNHGLAQLFGRPSWLTVAGRSGVYVAALVAALRSAGGVAATHHRVTRVARLPGNRGVAVTVAGMATAESSSASAASEAAATTAAAVGERPPPSPLRGCPTTRVFDRVLFACHAPDVLAALGDGASAAEQSTLGAFGYAPNVSVVHTDTALMPRSRSVWASWNVLSGAGPGPPVTATAERRGVTTAVSPSTAPVCVSYYTNRLLRLPAGSPDIFQTLNPPTPPAPATVLATRLFTHPQFTAASLAAAAAVPALQGPTTYYAGAYTRYGFHEDGLMSGFAAADALASAVSAGDAGRREAGGVTRPWAPAAAAGWCDHVAASAAPPPGLLAMSAARPAAAVVEGWLVRAWTAMAATEGHTHHLSLVRLDGTALVLGRGIPSATDKAGGVYGLRPTGGDDVDGAPGGGGRLIVRSLAAYAQLARAVASLGASSPLPLPPPPPLGAPSAPAASPLPPVAAALVACLADGSIDAVTPVDAVAALVAVLSLPPVGGPVPAKGVAATMLGPSVWVAAATVAAAVAAAASGDGAAAAAAAAAPVIPIGRDWSAADAHAAEPLGDRVVAVPPVGGESAMTGCGAGCRAVEPGQTVLVLGGDGGGGVGDAAAVVAAAKSGGVVAVADLETLAAAMAAVSPSPSPPTSRLASAPTAGGAAAAVAADNDDDYDGLATPPPSWTVLVSDAHAAAAAHWDGSLAGLLRWFAREAPGGQLALDALVVAPAGAAAAAAASAAATASGAAVSEATTAGAPGAGDSPSEGL
ncbi:hypothetical protein MMPV_003689 [Pyropia vietnamensis]